MPASAQAHGFGRLYNLPVPFWLYAWGAAGALLVSFLVIGYFASAPAPENPGRTRDLRQARWVRVLRRWRVPQLLQGLSLAALLLCIATGFVGTRDPSHNFSMTAFWVLFVLGLAYLTAVTGNLYARINPWATLVSRVVPSRFTAGRMTYPEPLGDWPALGFYMAFVWIELFGFNMPATLAVQLSVYTLLNLAGAWLVGERAWFTHCELFSVFLRHVARVAPLDYQPGESLRLRPFFVGVLEQRPARYATLVFVLFMLSSTAFDGLRATQWWVSRFWNDPYGIVTALSGEDPMRAYVRLRPWYVAWETLCLIASPFLYLGVYLGFIALARAITRSARSLRELALDFAYTLLPIALVYNFTHYFTLILTQGVKIVSLLSDPFGRDWNLFGTANLWRAPILPELGLVWHAQVGLILLGHVVAVYLAHRVALRVFKTRRQALLSQLPMLVLMMLFTVAGLWILAQPLTVMLMR